MDDATWDSLFRHLPEIILAICGGITLIYQRIKGTKAINDGAKAIKENTQLTKDSVDEMSKAHESINILADEAKEIYEKQKNSSDEMLRLVQERLKESDDRLAELMKEKEKKDS